MADKIRLSPSELRELSMTLRECANSLASNGITISQVLDQLNSIWSGEAVQRYSSRIMDEKEGLYHLQDQLEQLADIVESAASAMEETDQAISSLFRL